MILWPSLGHNPLGREAIGKYLLKIYLDLNIRDLKPAREPHCLFLNNTCIDL